MLRSTMLAASARAAAPLRAPSRPGARRPAVALPLRHSLPPPAAATASPGPGQSAFGQLVASGAKPTKTAVSKLSVAELRAECQLLGLPAEGLKAALVDRLLGWWEAQRQQPAAQQAQQVQHTEPDAAPAEAAAGAAPAGQLEGHAAPATQAARSSNDGAADAQQQQQQQQAQRSVAAAGHQHQPQEQGSDGEEGQRQAGEERRRSSDVPWMAVTWLGTSSGSPTSKRNVSAIAVQHGDDLYLVDAGEGTRHQVRRNRAPLDPGRVRAIFVTHTHGDHCFGLGGMIEAICQARLGTPLQHEPLHIYGPKELQSLVAFSIRAGGAPLTTPVVVTGFVLDPTKARPPTKVDASGMLLFELQGPDAPERLPAEVAAALPALQEAYDAGSENVVQPGLSWMLRAPGGMRVAAAQLQHRVPCWGYVFQEPHTRLAGPPEAAPADAEQDGEDSAEEAQQGQQAQQQGQQWVRRGRKLVILGDTCDSTAIAPLAMGCDLLSHEATFCSGMEAKADIAQHSTTLMAGAFAADVAARMLVLTHFSARYESVSGHAQAMKRDRKGVRKAELRAQAAENGALFDELKRLWAEAFETYGRPTIKLANDFFTVNVAPPEPVPVEQLRQQEMQLQHEAAAVLQRGTAQRGRPQTTQRQPYGQREGRPREQYGQRGGQQQWRDHRRDGPGRPSYDRRGGGGGSQQRRGGGRPQQQWQQRPGGGQSGDLRGWPDN